MLVKPMTKYDTEFAVCSGTVEQLRKEQSLTAFKFVSKDRATVHQFGLCNRHVWTFLRFHKFG